MKHSAKMTVVYGNFYNKAIWEKMLDLIYELSNIMIRICNGQMIAFIMLPIRHGSALRNIISITNLSEYRIVWKLSRFWTS